MYGPYFGAGIRVETIRTDWRELHVSMKLRWFNRNVVGTHFGGSLYAMADPHLMLLLMQVLGDDYTVWDQAASIEFKRPGRGTVRTTIRITDEDLACIQKTLENGNVCRPEFDLTITDESGQTVANVHKILYVRRKKIE